MYNPRDLPVHAGQLHGVDDYLRRIGVHGRVALGLSPRYCCRSAEPSGDLAGSSRNSGIGWYPFRDQVVDGRRDAARGLPPIREVTLRARGSALSNDQEHVRAER